MASAGKVSIKGNDLFGDFEDENSTFDQEVDLQDYVSRLLTQEASDYAHVGNVKRAERVADAGNSIAVEENQKRRKIAESNSMLFENHVNLKGPVSDTIRSFAAKLAVAKTKREKDDIRQECASAVRESLGQVLNE